MKINGTYIFAGGVALVTLLWLTSKSAKGTGETVGGAIVDLADGVVSGVVVGAGEAVGIPATNMTECERAKAEGRTWDASFACPAGNFIKYIFS